MKKARHCLVNTPKMSAMVGNIDGSFLVSLTKSTSFSAVGTFGSMLEKAF